MKILEQILRQTKSKKSGSGYLGHCPAHEDRKPSLSISQKDSKILVKCHAGCETSDILAALGLEFSDLFSDERQRSVNEPLATYDYTNKSGQLLYQVLKYPGKKFVQRRPNGSGDWLYNLRGITRVPYNLRGVIEAIKNEETVYIVEGEKDCENLAKIGLIGSTNSGGAGKWQNSLSTYFEGASVVILPDCDEPGRTHAEQVANNLFGVARSVKVIELPDLKEKEDISDWLRSGNSKESLLALVEKIINFSPSKSDVKINSDQVRDRVFIELNEFFFQQDQEIEWLAEGLIPLGWMAVIAGKSKSGKTLLALHLALCVASGENFLNFETKQGPVCLILLDDPASLVRERLKHFGFTAEMPVYVSTTRFRENGFFEHLQDELQEIRPRLVIVDTLVKTIPKTLGSENDSAVMDEALEKFMKIGETCGNPNFLFIHHFNKSGDIRGSSAIEGAAPLAIRMTKRKDGTAELEFETKLEPIKPIVVEFDSDNFVFNYLGERDEFVKKQTEDAISEFLSKNPGASTTEISKAVEHGIEKVTAILNNSPMFDCEEQKHSGAGRPKKKYFLREKTPPPTRT